MSEPLRYIYTVTRRPSRDDAGAIEEGSFCVSGNTVILYDVTGKTVLGKREIVAPFTAHETAQRMLKGRPARTRSFNRKLHYPKLAY
jgi:hypothetical protein